MNNRTVGTLYEEKTAIYLQHRGYRILERNYRCKLGEIDLIASHGPYLVFIEVKYRRNGQLGEGADAVDWRKQQRIIRTASWYLMEKGIGAGKPCRFDVVSVTGDRFQLIQDAFQL